ncbi:MAG TPA: carboxymuconolactone decarboxylase family protein [Gemmatimonadales bacterium]|nr:carboxymuconolactone decarboxylase family protein [Gemmatimonadales bacterium]
MSRARGRSISNWPNRASSLDRRRRAPGRPPYLGGWQLKGLDTATALDRKPAALAYLALLAALRLESGVPFHVKLARRVGASRDEVISALLIGLPAAGHGVTQVLPAAIQAYDSD